MKPDLAPLLPSAQEGDRQAMAALLEPLAPTVHRCGGRLRRHPDAAAEVVEEPLLDGAAAERAFGVCATAPANAPRPEVARARVQDAVGGGLAARAGRQGRPGRGS